MKLRIYAILAAAASCGLASAAATAYTTPVGYETLSLPAGTEYNLIGLRLHSPTIASGASTSVSGTVFSDSSVDFDALLAAGRTYVLEITSGAFSGLVQEVFSWGTGSGNTANDLVTPVDLTALGVVAGDTYSLRVAPTLEEIFDTSNLTPGFVVSQADLVWVPDGLGGFDQYFISALSGNPWKSATTLANTPNVPIVYQDGLLVQKRATSPTTSVVVTARLKPNRQLLHCLQEVLRHHRIMLSELCILLAQRCKIPGLRVACSQASSFLRRTLFPYRTVPVDMTNILLARCLEIHEKRFYECRCDGRCSSYSGYTHHPKSVGN